MERLSLANQAIAEKGIKQPIKKEATDERRGLSGRGGLPKNRDSPGVSFFGESEFPIKSSNLLGKRREK